MTDDEPRPPWDDPRTPLDIDARRVYEHAIAVGGSRRRSRQLRRWATAGVGALLVIVAGTAAVANATGPTRVQVSGSPNATSRTRPPASTTLTTTSSGTKPQENTSTTLSRPPSSAKQPQPSSSPTTASPNTQVTSPPATGNVPTTAQPPITTSPTRPTTTTQPPPATFTEQEATRGVNTFTDHHGATGMGSRINPEQYVQVSCKVYDPAIASVNPDGYWYRIANSPWNNQYYAPANTFWNGDTPGQTPYTHNTDLNVRNC